jgi:hypothetical protein
MVGHRGGILATSTLGAVALVACSSNALPGSSLGQFTVTAHLVTNTCSLPAYDPWVFDVQLSETSSAVLYWSYEDGSPNLSSALSSQNEAMLVSSDVANVDPTEAGTDGPCTMERDDQIGITLDSASAATSFQGTLGYSFSASAGSNCADQLVGAGGMYQTLPCAVSYTLTALRQ